MQVRTEYSFTGLLESVKLHRLTNAVYLPHHILVELPKGRLKISGTLNGAPFSLALHYRRTGARFITVGNQLRKAARVEAGDRVAVNFRVLNVFAVELPDSFEAVSNLEKEAKNLGRKFAKPERYSFSHYIADIKNMDVRIRRSIETIQRSRVGLSAPQPNSKKNRNK